MNPFASFPDSDVGCIISMGNHQIEWSQQISIENKMVHGLNQAMFRTKNFGNLVILDFFSS